jgi:quinol monooxygenase YgiN
MTASSVGRFRERPWQPPPLGGNREARGGEAFEEAIVRVHDEPGVELYALHEGSDRLVMIEKYESAEARSEHSRGAPLADLRSALDGKLTTGLDVQVLEPHPAGNAQKGAL